MTVITEKLSHTKVEPINWKNVRPVYKKLQDDFHLITKPFQIKLSGADNLHLSHLIATIDAIDRILDALPSRAERAGFASALLNYLNGSVTTIASDHATEETRWRVKNLRNVLRRLGITVEFCDAAARVFEHTEEKRWASSATELTYHLREEWRMAGHMTILVMADKATPAFNRFFYLCCEMMTAVDMIKDARSDFSNGEISLRPSVKLYVILLCEFLIPLPKLFWRFPMPLNLIKYAFSFLIHVYANELFSSGSEEISEGETDKTPNSCW